jgi:RNA polymerase sigma-70 factor (ECF subfamily)
MTDQDGARDSDRVEGRSAQLFAEHHTAVLAYATRRVGLTVAGDVAAQTFEVALRRIDDVPAGPAARPWLLATARNVLLASARADARRAAREVRAADRTEPSSHHSPDHAARVAELDVVLRALDQVSEPDRELLLLVAWDGLRLADAAVVLGCSAGAVRVRWLRARRRFADALGAVDGEPPPRDRPAPVPPLPTPPLRQNPLPQHVLGGQP